MAGHRAAFWFCTPLRFDDEANRPLLRLASRCPEPAPKGKPLRSSPSFSPSRGAGRKLISVAAISAALLAGTTTSVAVAQTPAATVGAGPDAQAVAAPAERLIVGYKSGAAEARSNTAADADAR